MSFVLLLYLIEILHQTTTVPSTFFLVVQLYLIEILHQTTTSEDSPLFCYTLYLIEILHQTTTDSRSRDNHRRCILSKFYIKPQRCCKVCPGSSVVSYRNSTSNHNSDVSRLFVELLYLIEILHQTTTGKHRFDVSAGCILSKFYIKPQLSTLPTSSLLCCILSKFYIKPQQRIRHKIGHSCCILSKFYIKPQLKVYAFSSRAVVSYRNSTSNHNTPEKRTIALKVVSYRNSTSNHNSFAE